MHASKGIKLSELIDADAMASALGLPVYPKLTGDTLTFINHIGRAHWEQLMELQSDGLNLNVFAHAIGRLVDFESSKVRPGGGRNRRRSLEKTLECLKAAHKCLNHGSGFSPHLKTMDLLQQSCNRLEADLKDWGTAKKHRGPTPETRITVALIAYVREQTIKAYWKELAALISRAYYVADLNARCTVGGLKQLWKKHRNLRANWQTILGMEPPIARKSVFEAASARHKKNKGVPLSSLLRSPRS